MSPGQLFVVLVVAGVLLVGAEIFVPGGVLGTVGAICLLVAIIMGYRAFGAVYGSYLAGVIVILVGLTIVAWARYFPKTPLGRRMTVSRDLATFKATQDGLDELVGKTGTALSDLRPAGFARIDGRRIDVVTEGGMIPRGRPIRVIDTDSNRVIVAEYTSPEDGKSDTTSELQG